MLTETEIVNILMQKMKLFELEMNPLSRKQTGSYYTSLELSAIMMKELINNLPKSKRNELYKLRFLEPCVGTGSFVFAYLIAAKSLNFTKEQYTTLVNNIYVCDINRDAIMQYKKSMSFLSDQLFQIDLSNNYFDTHIGRGLLFDVNNDMPRYISIEEVLGKNSENSFDIVATNPPYKNLKAEHSHYNDGNVHEKDKVRYSIIGASAARNLKYSTAGTLNLYKLFVEEIMERYVSENGIVSLLIPSSLLTDKTCEKLRTRILETAAIKSVKIIGEDSRFVDAQQALCALLAVKGEKSDTIDISTDFGGKSEESITIKAEEVISVESGNAILALNSESYSLFQRLSKFPRIRQLHYIVNMRGELDLTSCKDAIVQFETPYQLIRGRNIDFYQLRGIPSGDYVKEEFVASSAKSAYVKNERLICQQISNMASERRLTFALAEPNVVLGNSCNFITVKENEDKIDLFFVLGVLNSSLLNWFFKLQSSNNHINNYDIDNLPIPVSCQHKSAISELVREYLGDVSNNEIINKVEMLVQKAFLSEEIQSQSGFDEKFKKYFNEKTTRLANNILLNHTTFKLSDLDLEMIRSVPQGGSWKNIPQSTVQKSQRLIRINETGGRTTLYGRIDYSKPSYTITTYFNRPGNGTYVHPVHNRVISVREAARFQSFPDSYYFCGNKSQLLNQVGNAVPPLLAYQIGRKIFEVTGCSTSLDLFCGAGGMTYGFKLAGIHSALANDIDEAACLTLKVNNPEIEILCGDITDEDVKSKMVAKAKNSSVDIICGGPPCQGFSMAGYRLTDDPRNQLFKDFVDVVSRVNPKIIVFENVEGLLNFQNGQTYRCIHDMFSSLGYNTEGRVLATHHFGVPQKRKRVIIICTQKNLGYKPSDLYPKAITPKDQQQVSAFNTIADLEIIDCDENAKKPKKTHSAFTEWVSGKVSINQYLSNVTSATNLENEQKESQQLSLFDLVDD